jgi:hypothetical protein
MLQTDTLRSISKTTKTLVRIAGIVGAITVIGGGYGFYVNNFYKPNVIITLVDFQKGYAEFTFRRKKIILEGDATYLLDGDWGVRFGTKMLNDKTVYTSLELTKKGMVYEYITR